MSNSKGFTGRCTTCGFRLRGSNHGDGKHHAGHRPAKVQGKYPGSGRDYPGSGK